MTLKNLSLENFQGIRALDLDFGGSSATIFGANEAGKTTVFNAVTWLLFGQASTGASNFTPQTIDESGEVHGLDHSVKAVFICPDGSELMLARVYHEVYTKKRGSTTEVFSGHTTEYYVDDVPVAEKSYTETLLQIFGSVETMRLLTMPDFFPSRYEWKARRNLLLDICGDVSDADVVAAYEGELKDLPTILKKPGNTDQLYTVEEYRAIASRQMQEINRELQGIPARVDEATKAMPVMDGTAETYEACKAESDRLRRKVADLEAGRRNATADAMQEQARAKLLAVKNKLEAARQAHAKSEREEKSETLARIDAATHSVSLLERTIKELSADLELETRSIEYLHARRQDLASEYDALQKRTYIGDLVCPSCGQMLPDEARQRAIAEFNLAKSRALEDLNTRGKRQCSKEMIAAAQANADQIRAKLTAARENLVTAQSELRSADAAMPSITPFEQTPLYARLMADVRDCETALSNADAMVDRYASCTDTEIAEANAELDEALMRCTLYEQRDKQQARIRELMEKEKDLSLQYEVLERGVALCDAFVRNKVAMLTERINGRFSSVRFILFDEQVNGGLRECCEVAVPATDGSLIPYAFIPYAFANNAAKLNAGLEIIGVLAQHFGVSLPVVVDNAESVTEIRAAGIEQLIKLVVSPVDTQLRLETTVEAGAMQWGA